MTLKQSAYGLTTAINKAEDRVKLRDLIHSLNRVDEQRDRSNFGYLARKQHLQFLGFLLVDFQRSTNPKASLLPIPEIDLSEIELLVAAHESFMELSNACLAPVANLLPNPLILVDTYTRYGYKSGGYSKEINLLTEPALQQVVESFHNHPAIGLLIESVTNLIAHDQAFDFDGNRNLILQLEKELKLVGPTKTPDILHKMFLSGRQSEVYRHSYNIMSSILSIKNSLDVLRQLLFQAVLMDKLPVLNNENVFDVSGGRTNLARYHVSSFQIDHQIWFVQPTEVVFANINADAYQIKDLCLMGAMQMSLSIETGNTMSAEFWELDGNLNPYPGLLKMFQQN